MPQKANTSALIIKNRVLGILYHGYNKVKFYIGKYLGPYICLSRFQDFVKRKVVNLGV